MKFSLALISTESEVPSAIKMLTRSSTLLRYTLTHFEYSTPKPPTSIAGTIELFNTQCLDW